MTTQAQKERRINASQKRLDEINNKQKKHKDALSDLDARRQREQQHMEWLKAMPVAPEPQPEPEGDVAP